MCGKLSWWETDEDEKKVDTADTEVSKSTANN